jgi:hypothetical protein
MCSLVDRRAPQSALQESSLAEGKMVLMMIVEKSMHVSPIFASWFGKPVALHVVIRQRHVPLPCSIIDETTGDVRVRVQPGLEIDVRKEFILAVEEGSIAPDTGLN